MSDSNLNLKLTFVTIGNTNTMHSKRNTEIMSKISNSINMSKISNSINNVLTLVLVEMIEKSPENKTYFYHHHITLHFIILIS